MANEMNSIWIDVVDRGPVIDYNETDSISVYTNNIEKTWNRDE